MSPRTKKARTIRFFETSKEIQCLECDACCPESYFLTFDDWMFTHADTFHRTPETVQARCAPSKKLPFMAERTTPEEYRKLKKEARRRRQFKGIKDRGEGASFRWI